MAVIKKCFNLIKCRWKYAKCYSKMEDCSIAALGNCEGKNRYNPNTGTKHASRKCLKCPYYTRVDD